MRRLLTTALLILFTLVVLAGCGRTTTVTRVVTHAALPPAKAPVVKPALRPATPPAGDREAKLDGLRRAGGAACGRERWDVKTATDPAAATIDRTPADTTVAQLDQLPSTNPDNPDQPRDRDVESHVYRIHATLDSVKQEADSDFHLALSDGHGNTMIAEVPDAPACTQPPVTAVVSTLEPQVEQARDAFVQLFGEPSTASWTTIAKPVTITGVGFFDKPHGQRNVAPNAVELHPVLSITSP